jgi:hypothetical protein
MFECKRLSDQTFSPLAENDVAIEDQWMDTAFISDNKLFTRMEIENEIIESD